jgi:transposase
MMMSRLHRRKPSDRPMPENVARAYAAKSVIRSAVVRTALFEAADIMLTKPLKGCTVLKSWAMRIARRAGMKKAKVALARMLVNGTVFNGEAKPMTGV